MTVFICNILQSASITEVSELCLVISQTLGHLAKCFLGMPGRTGGYFSDCLEVWFVGLVVGRNCVSCLVIVVIFMGFGQAGAKRCGGCLKVINWGWRCKSQKRGCFHREGRFSLCNTAVLWNFIASLTGYILQKILLDASFHYTTVVLRVWVWQGQKCNSKCPNDINTEWAIPEKFFSFLVYPWKFQTKQGFTPRNYTPFRNFRKFQCSPFRNFKA